MKSIQFKWNYILDETEDRIETAVQVSLHSVWVESPEGRGFTLLWGRGGGAETRNIRIQFQDQGVMTPLLGRASG